LRWNFDVPKKTPKVIHWLADCDSVKRGQEVAGTRETSQMFSSGVDVAIAILSRINRLTAMALPIGKNGMCSFCVRD
jgi:hypothetical protein